jgi:formylglycine-generating enzyme required for sulfatase activity
MLAPTTCPTRMAGLPGGTFTLGERKAVANVQPFCMDLTEVTVDSYAACVRSGLCSADHLREWDPAKPTMGCDGNYGVSGKGNHPMNCVDRNQAARYCEAQCKRLPTEKEWEWAARGASAANKYPWGNAEPEPTTACFVGHPLMVLNHNPTPTGPNPTGTCAVGSFPKGDAPGGIHDLAGNVSEWTSSEEAGNGWIVIRGGDWQTIAEGLTAAGSTSEPSPLSRSDSLGFRCVREPPSGDGGLACPRTATDASTGSGDATPPN